MILEKAQHQLLNKSVRLIHVTTEALDKESDSLHHKLETHLPSAAPEKVTDFIKEAQIFQCAKSTERRAQKIPTG